MEINWTAFEDSLFRLVSTDIRQFAADHGQDTFYGFAFDCNSEYGNILLCFNTPDYLRERAVEYATNPPNQTAFDDINKRLEEALGKKIFSERKPTTPEQEELKLRWSLGDWKYQGFNSRSFDTGWQPFESAVLDACMDEEEDEETFMTPTQDRFMRAACRVLIRLESDNVFAAVSRTPDFRTYVADHADTEEDSWGRLETIRNDTTGA